MQKNNKEIVHILVTEHIDTMRYGLGLTNFKKMRELLGLFHGRKLGHTIHTIWDEMIYIQKWYPTAGALDAKSILFHEHNIDVPKSVIVNYFHTFEPKLVAQQKIGHLKRRKFWAAGVNDIWAVDQHNKWKLLGLWLHVGVEPFSGHILWIRVWWSNRILQLICSYFLDVADKLSFILLITQSDSRSENLGVANAQMYMRQDLDPALQGTLQHCWMRNKKNIVSEISWSLMRRHMTPGFEHELWKGVEDDSYDCHNVLDKLLFWYLFIPWVQAELNHYIKRTNYTIRCADKYKILPTGVLLNIFDSPHQYGTLNFKVITPPRVIAEARQLYVNPEHEVFQLVPPDFMHYATRIYNTLGTPAIIHENI
ncbi:hypothetical protein AN958_01417 [Leucoagaricus sp. SymC.cos]|nr:hypothetical protein AN958_01417 [Leucoagaricus sp. SymC.cos]